MPPPECGTVEKKGGVRMKKWLLWLVLPALLLASPLYLGTVDLTPSQQIPGENAGVERADVLDQARSAHRIEADWEAVQASADATEAMLFYDLSSGSSPIFSIWTVRSGEDGYFFRRGGSSSLVTQQVGRFRISGAGYDETIYLSRNMPQVARAEIGGKFPETVEFDPEKPFALALEGDPTVHFFDIRGVRLTAYSVGDITISEP